jgi:hypothetical protein
MRMVIGLSRQMVKGIGGFERIVGCPENGATERTVPKGGVMTKYR